MVFYETYKLKVEHECIRHQKKKFFKTKSYQAKWYLASIF